MVTLLPVTVTYISLLLSLEHLQSVKITLSNISVMKFKIIFKYTFKLLCLAFVIERSTQCFIRFSEKPQAVEIKMSDGLNEILPHFQVCPENQYNHTVFENCGLEL